MSSTPPRPPSSLLLEPHHDGSALHVSDAAPEIGDDVACLVRVPRGGRAVRSVHARVLVDAEPRFVEAVLDREDEAECWYRVDVPVRNPVASYRFLLDHGNDGYSWLTGAGVRTSDVTDAEDFRLVAHPAPPAWVQDACVYQVFPDRFARSGRGDAPPPEWAVPTGWDEEVVHRGPLTPRQLYGGDLYGVAQHLDHVADLGADVVYTTPFFPAGSNHRYDAWSFDGVDPLLGGDEALVELVRAAHARGMRVLGDLTTNHTGDGHEWFRAARAGGADERSLYYWGEDPHGYASWLDVPSLPVLNWRSEELRRRLVDGKESVVSRWLRPPYDLDGWRIDVAHMTGRRGRDDLNHEVARLVQATAREARDDAWVLAEYFHDPSGQLLGDGWHGTMNYPGFLRPVWAWLDEPGHGVDFLGLPVPVPRVPGAAAAATMRRFHAAVPWRTRAASVNLLGSHDSARVRTIVGRDKQRVALALLATSPGVPMVFAGDEIGLTAVDGEHARTPFPWHDRSRWDESTLADYRTWLRLRRDNVALRRGGWRWAHVGEDSLTFVREHPDQRVLVHVARADHAPVRLPLALLGAASPADITTLDGEDVVGDGPEAIVLPRCGPAAHAYALPGTARRG